MKPVSEIVSLEAIAGLPSSDGLRATVDRVNQIQSIKDMREFHATNISYNELDGLLCSLGALHFEGSQKGNIANKLKRLKPSKNVIAMIDFI
ncbi:MAG: hypothetical protein PHY47_00970 [Lachnospiraceae bacterium]|nr:hypothetical protein [Lachnospiraceae bacterium]